MPTLLLVHHTPSPALQEMFEAVVRGARTDEIEGVEVVIRPALTAAPADVLRADGFVLGTPANIGYMSGALKHFFDGIYYPCLEATRRRPYGLYVHGGLDTGGAVRAVESITTGLQWRAVRPPVCVTGPPGKADLEACWELGALVAAEVADLAERANARALRLADSDSNKVLSPDGLQLLSLRYSDIDHRRRCGDDGHSAAEPILGDEAKILGRVVPVLRRV